MNLQYPLLEFNNRLVIEQYIFQAHGNAVMYKISNKKEQFLTFEPQRFMSVELILEEIIKVGHKVCLMEWEVMTLPLDVEHGNGD